MADDLMGAFEDYHTAQAMWVALKDKYGGTSTTKVRWLTIKFDTYRKGSDHTIRQHLREMANMIRELKSAGHVLTNKQQVQAMIRSLLNSWENIKINMTHNDNIKTFDDIFHHVELEDERLEAAKSFGQLYMADSNVLTGTYAKRKRGNKGSKKDKDLTNPNKPGTKNPRKKARRGKGQKRDMSKIKY